jgi:hypothetical protein
MTYFLRLLLLLLAVPGAWACAICAPADGQNSLLLRLLAADTVVLAAPDSDGAGYKPKVLIKGTLPTEPIGLLTIPDLTTGKPATSATPANPADTQVLLWRASAPRWTDAGPLSLERADWLRQLLKLPRPANPASPTDPAWSVRAPFLVADLESPQPWVAQAVYEELAIAPYAVMRTLKPRLDPLPLKRWMASPDLLARRSLYILLFGIAATPASAPELAQQLLAVSASRPTAEVSALLAAYLEIQGDAGVDWVEQHFLLSATRSETEQQAALLALSVHGNEALRLSKERVVQAYARFIQHNPSRAGFVASDLANWARWEFGATYVALLKSGQPQVFSSRYAMVFFLLRSPQEETRKALQALRVAGVL